MVLVILKAYSIPSLRSYMKCGDNINRGRCSHMVFLFWSYQISYLGEDGNFEISIFCRTQENHGSLITHYRLAGIRFSCYMRPECFVR